MKGLHVVGHMPNMKHFIQQDGCGSDFHKQPLKYELSHISKIIKV